MPESERQAGDWQCTTCGTWNPQSKSVCLKCDSSRLPTAAPSKSAASQLASTPLPQQPALVRVVDVDISFGQMVVLLLKLAVAAIPAAIILSMIGFIVVLILAALFGIGRH